MNTKTKLTALLMSILMIVAMIPTFAIAASADGNVAAVSVDGGATFTGYATFKDAFQIATGATNTNGAILKLLQNTDMGTTAQNVATSLGPNLGGKSVTLDLNGYILQPPTGTATETGPSNHFALNNGSDNLTIMDSNPTNSHWYSVNGDGLYVWSQEAETNPELRNTLIEIKGGALTGGDTLTNNQDYGASIYCNKAQSLTILGGNFIGNKAKQAVIKVYRPTAAIKVSGGLFIGNTTTSTKVSLNMYLAQYDAANSNFTGGTFVGSTDVDLAPGYALVEDSAYAGAKTVVPTITFVGAQQSTDKTAIRLIAAVEKSAIIDGSTLAGFDVAKDEAPAQNLASSYYYTKLLAQDDIDGAKMTDITTTLTDYVLIAVVINNIPEGTNATLTVTPTLSTGLADGEMIRSAQIAITNSEVTSITWAN